MVRIHKRGLLLAMLSLCVFALPGCGRVGATIHGTIVLPPDLRLNDTDSVLISFVPEDLKGQTYPAVFSVGENTFVADGVAKKGIPPGKYKIVLEVHPYPGGADSEARAAVFEHFNQSFNAGGTALTYEVTSESPQSIALDLVQRTVTKN